MSKKQAQLQQKNREDEAWDKGFMREDSAKKFKDSLCGTMSQASEQSSITIEEPTENFRDSKDPVSMGDIMQDKPTLQ